MPDKQFKKIDLFYIAESIGQLKGEVSGIKKDIEELSSLIHPLIKKVYYNAGKIAVGAVLASAVVTIIINYLVRFWK